MSRETPSGRGAKEVCPILGWQVRMPGGCTSAWLHQQRLLRQPSAKPRRWPALRPLRTPSNPAHPFAHPGVRSASRCCGMERKREWAFKAQATQLVGAVTSIDFCAARPHDYCASAGTRLHVFDGASSTAKRQFARFKDKAYSGSFRRDGRLLVAGGEDSVIQARGQA